MHTEFYDFQISNNTMIVLQKVNNELVTTEKETSLDMNEIETSILKYPYRGQRRIKDEKSENFRLPSIAQVFYALIYTNKIPSAEMLCVGYLKKHFTAFGQAGQCKLNGTEELFLIEGVKARVYRAYPSLLRDFHFYFLCKDSNMFEDVFYSLRADAYEGIDLKITYKGQQFAIALFVNTARSRMFKSRKYGRHDTLTIPEICLEIDPFNKSYHVGDYALYRKDHLFELSKTMESILSGAKSA